MKLSWPVWRKRRQAERRSLPVIPPLPAEPPYDPNPEVAVCGECGLVLRRVMSYSCGRARCPVQTRVPL